MSPFGNWPREDRARIRERERLVARQGKGENGIRAAAYGMPSSILDSLSPPLDPLSHPSQ